MLYQWGYGEFSNYLLMTDKCLCLYTYQRFRQLDGGYLGSWAYAQSGESGVGGGTCKCGIGGELSGCDSSYTVGDGEDVGGIGGAAAGILTQGEAIIALGFRLDGESYHVGVVAGILTQGDVFGGRGFVTGLLRREGEGQGSRMDYLQGEGTFGARGGGGFGLGGG